jgi:hypothetical protein
MTNQEILTKAIEKAIEGGWHGCHVTHSTTDSWTITGTHRLCVSFSTGGNAYYHPNEIIYSHEFAKALWGEKRDEFIYVEGSGDPFYGELWQHHLQQMVIAEDPIAYLGQHLPE